MQLLSVNVSRPQDVGYRGKTVGTAIFKKPVAGRHRVWRLNLEGDGQADLKHHGGPDQAVYAYTIENYEYWAAKLGRDDLRSGQFGENLTVQQMPERRIHVGDTFRIGSATVQVSQPRTPCFKLDIRMNVEGFAKQFHESGRVGFYLRVLEEGEVGAGDVIERVEVGQGEISVHEVWRVRHVDRHDLEGAARVARLGSLSEEWRRSLAKRLVDANGTREDR